LRRKRHQIKIKEAKLKYDELNTRILKADHATRDFTKNVGNYSSAFGKGVYAIQSLAGAFGLLSAIGIGTMIFNQVRELNALESALKKVTETSDGYIQAQTYIIDLARLTGVEYTKLTGSYTKFYASAKNTNLTLDQTQAIFAAVTKSSAVLGLSLDDTEGALRAVEQMLSKGNVQAEEIRGQLGERLPGAFQILAKSMGVTTIELNKMLKDGKVIAEEVLPKFAEELERTFGVDNNNKIETLNASIGRMKTEWTLFLKGLEGDTGVVSNFFKTFTDGISNIIKGFNDLNRVTSIVGAPKWYEILGTPIQTAEIMRQYNGIIQTLDTTYSKIEKMQYNDATIEFLSDYIYKIQLHMEEINNLMKKKYSNIK
jgi:tape measure domain-containing protein